MKRGLAWIGLAVALGVIVAGALLSRARERQSALSPYASIDNSGPRGTAALYDWLNEGRFEPVRIEEKIVEPPRAATLVLPAPPGVIGEDEVRVIRAFAEAGGLVVWATGDVRSQPALERVVPMGRPMFESETADLYALPGRAATALAPHPLFEGLTLRTGAGQGVASSAADALAVAGGEGRVAAVSVRLGRGEVLLLAGAELLENFRINEGDNLAFWARVAARGPVAFDERHHLFSESLSEKSPPLGALLGQAALAGLVFAFARGRRLGALRPPRPPGAARTAADYLATLAVLYRRAHAEPELCERTWKRLRRDLASRAGIALRAETELVERRLARMSPDAARAFARAAAIPRSTARPAELFALERAVAELERALGWLPSS